MSRLDIVPDTTYLDHTHGDHTDPAPTPVRRVREEVRDGLAVAMTSVAASVGLVLVATLLMRLVG
jgi:hypothetical protein